MTTFRKVNGVPGTGTRTGWYDGASLGSPADGGFVHVVQASDLATSFPGDKGPAWPGMVYRVEAAESFSDGTQLATNGSGQARAASAGDVLVATALEASSGSGDIVWVVMESQREL